MKRIIHHFLLVILCVAFAAFTSVLFAGELDNQVVVPGGAGGEGNGAEKAKLCELCGKNYYLEKVIKICTCREDTLHICKKCYERVVEEVPRFSEANPVCVCDERRCKCGSARELFEELKKERDAEKLNSNSREILSLFDIIVNAYVSWSEEENSEGQIQRNTEQMLSLANRLR